MWKIQLVCMIIVIYSHRLIYTCHSMINLVDKATLLILKEDHKDQISIYDQQTEWIFSDLCSRKSKFAFIEKGKKCSGSVIEGQNFGKLDRIFF